MGWFDFLTAPERTDYATAPPASAAPAPSVWDQFMQMLDSFGGTQTATMPQLAEGTQPPMEFSQPEGFGRTAYQPGSVAGGDFGNILTAGIPKRQAPVVAPIGGYVQGGVARRQNNAGPLAGAALSYLGMQALGGGDAIPAENLPADAAALGAEGGAALGAAPAAAPTPPPTFWQQFITQTAKQVGFPDPYKPEWTGADYAQTLNTLAKMGGPKRPSAAPPSMAMPQLPSMAMPQLPQGTEGYRNPGPVFGSKLLPSTLDVWRPRQDTALLPKNPYGMDTGGLF